MGELAGFSAGGENPLKPFKKTGVIWRSPQSSRRLRVRKVCEALRKAYGTPRFGNPSDPLDDLIYIVLSNKTTPGKARTIYSQLRERFQNWDDLLTEPISVLRALLRPAGLSAVKSRHIRGALRAIKNDFGACDLRALKRLTSEASQKYLVGLPGVSEKVAKCVMLYTLNLPVLPVDAHVHRVSHRLGWTARKRADQCHARDQ